MVGAWSSVHHGEAKEELEKATGYRDEFGKLTELE